MLITLKLMIAYWINKHCTHTTSSETNDNYTQRINDVRHKYEFSLESGHIGSSLFWRIFYFGVAIVIIRYVIIIWGWVEITSQEETEDD